MKNYRGLTKIFTVLSIFLFLGLIIAKAQPSIYTLPIGTKIRVRMDNEINSKVSGVNDTFTATVSHPVFIRNVEIIPIGTIVEGRILEAKAAASGKVNGFLDVKFESYQLPKDSKRPFDASLVNQNLLENKSSVFTTLSIFGGTAIGAILGGIIGKGKGAAIGAGAGAGVGTAIALLKKGKEARIKANQEFEIRLDKEVTVPAKDF
ncbi:MAG TPA: hypothetical protein PKY82_24580 [Pyrinomonadaceae bacterium]|nr:hypothetical protein [Pyrinomonadaceae bacterium]